MPRFHHEVATPISIVRVALQVKRMTREFRLLAAGHRLVVIGKEASVLEQNRAAELCRFLPFFFFGGKEVGRLGCLSRTFIKSVSRK